MQTKLKSLVRRHQKRENLTCKQLRALLREKGRKVSGCKEELIARLFDDKLEKENQTLIEEEQPSEIIYLEKVIEESEQLKPKLDKKNIVEEVEDIVDFPEVIRLSDDELEKQKQQVVEVKEPSKSIYLEKVMEEREQILEELEGIVDVEEMEQAEQVRQVKAKLAYVFFL